MRAIHSLDGIWQFQLDPTGTLSPDQLAPDRTLPVPSPWQAHDPALWEYSGWAWYRRTFTVDDAWLTGDLLLHFGAVDYWCAVFINDICVGEHEGGYTPFRFSIRDAVRAGENTLTVRVYDPVQPGARHERAPRFPMHANGADAPFDAQSIPHGKQEWYINIGGIWQSVALIAIPGATTIERVHITPSNSGAVAVDVETTGSPAPVTVTLMRDGAVVAQATGDAMPLHLHVEAPALWSPDTPHLYTARIEAGGDAVTERFGFREVRIADGHLLINGTSTYLLCALDQDFYPETIYTVPSEAYLRDQFTKAKALGLNALRIHIKVPESIYFDLADELGLLIWAEIPSWRTFYPKGTYHAAQTDLDASIRRRAKTTLEAMIARDYNHPSIICWTIVNEDWGTMLPFSAEDRAWVREMVAHCRQLDPARLVVDNSPCPVPWGVNMHVESDLDDFHLYANIPDAAQWWADMVAQLGLRAGWTYSTYGDAVRTGHEPVIVSEFGSWGLPSLAAITQAGDPPWFRLGPWWSGWDGEPGWISGVQERFARYGLDRIYGTYEAMAERYQWHQFHALKYDIEMMRRSSAIRGYVITELTDIYWEANGLMAFDRTPKAYHARFRDVNAPDVLIPLTARYAFWDDETVTLAVEGSFYGPHRAGDLHIGFNGETHTRPIAAQPAAQTVGLAQVALTPAPVTAAAVQPIALALEGEAGPIARTGHDVLILPGAARRAAYPGLVGAAHIRRTFAAELATAGYAMAADWREAAVVVSSMPNAAVLDWLAGGGTLVYLAEHASPFYWTQGRGGAYSGNWLTCWSWLRPSAYRRLAHADLNPLTMPFVAVMPQRVITGVPVEDPAFREDILGGQISGWLNHPVVHTVQFAYGRGRVVMTTFDLDEAFGIDPVATAMLHDLIDHAAAANPTLRLK
jgi:hypothetical protein